MDSALIGVIIGGLLTLLPQAARFLWQWRAEKLKSHAEATNVALCAALALESFAVTCWPVSYSGREHSERTGEPLREDMPELEDMPSATEWRGLSVKIADAVMSFHNRIDAAVVIAQHARVFENNRFAFETEVIAKGREAWLLAERLRSEYDLPPQTELRNSLRSMLD